MDVPINEEMLQTDSLTAVRTWRRQLERGDRSFSNWERLGFPAEEILALFFATGKHFADSLLLEELVLIQHALTQLPMDSDASKISSALMRIFLDKHTNTYDHLSYIAMPIFEQFREECDFDSNLRNQAEVVIALICDLILFEMKTMQTREHRMQEHLPGMQKLKQRIFVSLRAVSSCIAFADHLSLPAYSDSLIEVWRRESLHEFPFPENLAAQTLSFAQDMLDQMNGKMDRLLKLTLVPVYVSHDEYLFIRILQAFENLFQVMAEGLKLCIGHIAAERYEQAANRFQLLNDMLRLSPALFRIISTMTSYTFNTFREYMRGASAIQSVYYKQIELYASHPDPHRLRSPAYESVPTVINEYLSPQFSNLQDVLTPLLMDAGYTQDASFQDMLAGMKALDKTFVAWKVTHFRLVKTLVGDAPGTGPTSGTPYLKLMLEMPLFPFLVPLLAQSAVI